MGMGNGIDACLQVIETAERFDGEGFERFLASQKLWEWFAPLAGDARARARLPNAVLTRLETAREEAPARTRALLALSTEVRDELAAGDTDALFLKGLAVSSRFYPALERRHQFDIDILVRPADFTPAVEALARLGFETRTPDLEARRQRVTEKRRESAPQALAVKRGRRECIDLHVRTKSRLFYDVDEAAYWHDRTHYTCRGETFATLSDEHALVLLLVSIAADLRRGACREKHFLDAYQLARAFDADWDWDGFLDAPSRRGLRKTLVNVLALLLTLWECADEVPRLAAALSGRARLIEHAGPRQALALVDRDGRSWSLHRWYRRLGSRSTGEYRMWRYLFDLPHTTRRSVRHFGRSKPPLPWPSTT